MRSKNITAYLLAAVLILIVPVVVGCTAATPAATATVSAATATATAVPTVTPTPTDTPAPTSTPVSKVISTENIENLATVSVINVSNDRVTAVAFSPLDHTLATFALDTRVRIYDADTGNIVRQLVGHGDWGLGLGYSPDGSVLASAGRGGDIHLWDPAKGTDTRKVAGSANRIYSLAWSRDGSKFAVGGDFSSTVNIFNSTGQRLKDIKLPGGWVWSVAWSDKYLAVSNDLAKTIYIYDANNYTLLQQLTHGGDPAGEMDFSPDGSLLVSCHRDPNMYIWQTSDWSLRATIEAHPKLNGEQGCLGGDFSKKGDIYFTGGDDGYLNAWDTTSGKQLKQFNFHNMVWGVAVSADGELLAAAMTDGTVRILALK